MIFPGFEAYMVVGGEPDSRVTARGNRVPNYRVRAGRVFASGRHWITGRPLLPDGSGTCGGCRYLLRAGRYKKCQAYEDHYVTASARTDVRLWWPACELYASRGGTEN